MRLSKAAHEHISAIRFFFATIITIAVILAILGWLNNQDLTSVLDSTVALRRTWYVLSKFQEKPSSRSCKTPQNHHHFHHHHHSFCPPCYRRKKLTLIATPNNNKCPRGQFFPLNRTSHRHNARLRNKHPQRPWPNFGDKYGTTIFPTGGQTVSYRSSTRQTENSKMIPLGLCLPFRPSHSVCCTQLSPWFNLPFTTTYIAEVPIICQGIPGHCQFCLCVSNLSPTC
jgi:hypothetical protein